MVSGLESVTLKQSRFQLVDGRTRPEFFFIGGAKCGSTSFAIYLDAHPQVYIGGPKEPNFWSWGNHPKDYQDYFVNEFPISRPVDEDRVSGEFSTSYLLHPLVPRRIYAALPEAKIILLLRNPVDRAYSHYMMSELRGFEPDCSFDEIVRREIEEAACLIEAHQRCFSDPKGNIVSCITSSNGTPIHIASHRKGGASKELTSNRDLRNYYFRSYVFRSLYHDQVKRWMTIFPADQLLILQSERFFADPPSKMAKVCKFLGLAEFDFASVPRLQKTFGGGVSSALKKAEDYKEMNPETRLLLESFFKPWNEKLSELTGMEFGWE
jgi:hypothetical protein